jgi:murein DD-endopeptidase MepM/ murein hydrolase activator NlpD
MLPEYDFYAFWDTMHVDAYRFDLRKLQETIPLIVLEMDCDFAMPIYGKTNSPFGWRHGRPHTGIDLQLRTGDSVYAMFDGVVRMSKYYNGYGNCVVVRHYNGLETLYAHLSKLDVRPGNLVNAGQLLGLGGSTGHSTGPHLHFEIRFLGRPLNPSMVVDFPNETVKIDTLNIESKIFQMPAGTYRYKKRRSRYRGSKSRKRRYSYEIRIEEVYQSLYRV